jgi:hypothetical protein
LRQRILRSHRPYAPYGSPIVRVRKAESGNGTGADAATTSAAGESFRSENGEEMDRARASHMAGDQYHDIRNSVHIMSAAL